MAKLVFFDDNYIAARPLTARRNFSPQKIGEYNDDDASLQLYTSYFYDNAAKEYRLYYEVPIKNKGTEVRQLRLATAQSADDFVNGNMQVYDVTGLDEEHGIHGCSITPTPDGRYLFLGNAHADDRKKRHFCYSFSKDGIHFSGVNSISTDYKDTYNSVYYNPYKKEFEGTTRMTTMDRRIAVTRSKDGTSWSEPQLILHPTECGDMGVQYYALGVSHLDGIFYGILWRFMTDITSPDFTDMGGYMENDLMYSYDGICFSKTGNTPLCQRPAPPEFGCKQLWLLNMEKEADRYVICGGATNIAHGSSYDTDKFAVTVFYSIRRDGFCALEGFSKNSIVYTKPILFEGGDIKLNVNASAGEVSLAVLDSDGRIIDGFGFEDCKAITKTDGVNVKVSFKNADTDDIRGKRVRFAIRLDNALLYALEFNGKPFLYTNVQKSFNDPTSER